jgi:predicted DCC family thiol-disulfide oxidoreductase YuxK
MARDLSSNAIVLFDGVCNFCNSSVRFIVRHDKSGRFHFAPLQSDVGRRLLEERHLPTDSMSTMLLIEGSEVSTRSTAALRIARHLRFPWWVAYYVFIAVPKFIRDVPYNIIARVRYRVFGRTDTCPLPPPGITERFLA